jgi:hypothetical protein
MGTRPQENHRKWNGRYTSENSTQLRRIHHKTTRQWLTTFFRKKIPNLFHSHSLWSQSRSWPHSEVYRPWTMNILRRPQSLILVKKNKVDTYTKFAVNAKEYNQVDRICSGVDRFPNVPRNITEPQWEKNYFWLYTMLPFLCYIWRLVLLFLSVQKIFNKFPNFLVRISFLAHL